MVGTKNIVQDYLYEIFYMYCRNDGKIYLYIFKIYSNILCYYLMAKQIS